MWLATGKLTEKCDELIALVNQSEGIELNIKRNYVTYLHHLLTE